MPENKKGAIIRNYMDFSANTSCDMVLFLEKKQEEETSIVDFG